MKSEMMVWMFLPEGLGDVFEIVNLERSDARYDIWLDEKKEKSREDRRNPKIVARGYTDYTTVQDFPLRGRPVYLHLRKNKWWNMETGEIFSYEIDLPNADGTRLSKEFVAFLKDEGRVDGA